MPNPQEKENIQADNSLSSLHVGETTTVLQDMPNSSPHSRSNEVQIIEVEKKVIPLIDLLDDNEKSEPHLENNQKPLEDVKKSRTDSESYLLACSGVSADSGIAILPVKESPPLHSVPHIEAEFKSSQLVISNVISLKNVENNNIDVEPNLDKASHTVELPEFVPLCDAADIRDSGEIEDIHNNATIPCSDEQFPLSEETTLDTDGTPDLLGENDQNNIQLPNDVDTSCQSKLLSDEDTMDVLPTEKKTDGFLRKLGNVSCHLTHSTKIYQRRLICSDCNTRLCPVCYCNFSSHLKQHMHTKGASEYQHCLDCGEHFVGKCAFQAHQNLHRVETPFVCPECGSVYQQLRFFILHSLERCYHFFRASQYHCDKCEFNTTHLDRYQKHRRTHHVGCRKCFKDRKKAVRRQKSVESLDVPSPPNSNCNCKKAIEDHWKEQLVVKKCFICPCGTLCHSVMGFKKHRDVCDLSNNLPHDWAELLINDSKSSTVQANAKKNSKELKSIRRLCKICFTFFFTWVATDDICINCSEEKPWLSADSLSCKNCDSIFSRQSENDEYCPNCIFTLKICQFCDDLFKPIENEISCEACRAIPDLLSEWVGGEEIVGTEHELHESCNVDYPGLPLDHAYCIRHDFTDRLLSVVDAQIGKFGFAFMKVEVPGTIPAPEPTDGLCQPLPSQTSKVLIEKSIFKKSKNTNPYLKCSICGFLLMGNSLYELLTHMKKSHENAVLPYTFSNNILLTKNSSDQEDDDVDLMTRYKKLKESKCVVKELVKKNGGKENTLEESADKANEAGGVSPRKRLRLYIPKKSEDCRRKYLVLNHIKSAEKGGNKSKGDEKKDEKKCSKQTTENEKIDTTKTNVPENITVEALPQKKDYEFWDGFYEALEAVDGRNIPKSKKEGVLGNMPSYCIKRQVKKPRRLVEEEIEEIQSACRKPKTSSESPSTQEKRHPEKIKVTLQKETETEIVPEKKAKKKTNVDVDLELEEVKKKLKRDDEMGFIAKTFDSDESNHSPNKRKRKLASKLVYLKKINETDLHLPQEIEDTPDSRLGCFTCIICKVEFIERSLFHQHLMTHRTDENTFQCMECGECFVVRPSLEKHLHAFHKIKEIAKYIADNQCNMKLGQEETPVEKEVKLVENQCKVCLEIFPCSLDLSKHFRQHGLAYLKLN